MKKLLMIVIAMLAISAFGLAQAPFSSTANLPSNVYAAGLSGNTVGSPAIGGTAAWGSLVSATTNTYSFTALDLLPGAGGVVSTNISTGIAQNVASFTISGKTIALYVPVTAGLNVQAANPTWTWTGGAVAFIPIKGSWMLAPVVRFAKQPNGYSMMPGLMIAWGQ